MLFPRVSASLFPHPAFTDMFTTGGWESVHYPPGTGASVPPAAYPSPVPPPACPPAPMSPFHFTSTFSIKATPDQVVNGTTPTGGLAGASGLYLFGLNSVENTICYNITLHGFRGDYSSPARTATHLHEAVRGASGSPRIAFPNPVAINADGSVRRSVGCMTGPFMTGLNVTGTTTDTGAVFKVAQIEANPAGFFADVHSSLAVPGAVRGQLA
jgi:hypothetical protein